MSEERKINFIGIGKGIAFSLILSFVFILIIAAVCYFMTVSEGLLSVLVFAAAGASVLLGAALVAKNACGSGFLHGLILGIGYLFVMLVAGILCKRGFYFNIQLATMAACVVACGMLGGILGINSKN